MKKVLITGANSYIGTNIEKWLMKNPDNFYVETLDMKDPNWVNFDFSGFDVVIHVAGIVHKKETRKNKNLYYKINRDLVELTALKAKKHKIGHFIFISSMSVYGIKQGVITRDTIPMPINNYGKSKLEAENILLNMMNIDFTVTVIRPPLIYGKNCPGNYSRFRNFANKSPFFVDVKNRRSMLYISNLALAIIHIINNKNEGILHVSNKKDISSFSLLSLIRLSHNYKTINVKFVSTFLKIVAPLSSLSSKIFGSLYYDDDLKFFLNDFFDYEESIKLTENGNV